MVKSRKKFGVIISEINKMGQTETKTHLSKKGKKCTSKNFKQSMSDTFLAVFSSENILYSTSSTKNNFFDSFSDTFPKNPHNNFEMFPRRMQFFTWVDISP